VAEGEQDGLRDVFGQQGRAFLGLPLLRFRVHAALAPELVQGVAGRDHGDADAGLGDFLPQPFGEAVDGVLGGRINDLPRPDGPAGDARRQEDLARRLGDEVRDGRAQCPQDAGEVEVYAARPDLRVALGDASGDGRAGVCEDGVQAPELLQCGRDQPVKVRLAGDVARHD